MSKIVKLPNTKQVKLGSLTLQLRLTPRDIFNIEKRLKESLIGLFINSDGEGGMPPLHKVIIVLQGANQVSGVSDEDVFNAASDFIEEGNTTFDLINIVQELLEENNFFGNKKKATGKKKEEKMNFEQEPTDFEV